MSNPTVSSLAASLVIAADNAVAAASGADPSIPASPPPTPTSGIGWFDPNSGILACDDVLAGLLGLRVADLMTLDPTDLWALGRGDPAMLAALVDGAQSRITATMILPGGAGLLELRRASAPGGTSAMFVTVTRIAEPVSADWAEQMPVGLFRIAADGSPELVNGTFASHLGWRDRTAFDEAIQAADPSLAAAMALILSHAEAGEIELEVTDAQGNPVWLELTLRPICDETGRLTALAGASTSIANRREREVRRLFDASHDRLTGLPNRTMLVDAMAQSFARAQRRGDAPCALLVLDLDRFKLVNDSFGQAVGDEVLQRVADRLRHGLRVEDTLARIGGDKFALLLNEVADIETVDMIAERMMIGLRQSFPISGGSIEINASVGSAIAAPGATHPDDLLHNAETAMAAAKNQGRNRHLAYSANMRSQAREELILKTQLRGAAERGELRVVYQAIQSMRENRITGFEALVRWEHPTLGLLSPSVFIPIAEECGLISEIGQWVMRTACNQFAEWSRITGDQTLNLSVNISPEELRRDDVVEVIMAILEQCKFPPHRLRLEVTESRMLDNFTAVREKLARLRRTGVTVAMDDFGTGYSSLAQLQHLPLDVLKIDRSFVARIDGTPNHDAIIKTIIALGHALGMTIVAEGVETEGHMTLLHSLGCNYAQGFLISRPVSAQAAFKLLHSGSITLN